MHLSSLRSQLEAKLRIFKWYFGTEYYYYHVLVRSGRPYSSCSHFDLLALPSFELCGVDSAPKLFQTCIFGGRTGAKQEFFGLQAQSSPFHRQHCNHVVNELCSQ